MCYRHRHVVMVRVHSRIYSTDDASSHPSFISVPLWQILYEGKLPRGRPRGCVLRTRRRQGRRNFLFVDGFLRSLITTFELLRRSLMNLLRGRSSKLEARSILGQHPGLKISFDSTSSRNMTINAPILMQSLIGLRDYL